MGLRCRLQAPSHTTHPTVTTPTLYTTLSRRPPAVVVCSISGETSQDPSSYSSLALLPYDYTWVHTPAYYPSTPRARHVLRHGGYIPSPHPRVVHKPACLRARQKPPCTLMLGLVQYRINIVFCLRNRQVQVKVEAESRSNGKKKSRRRGRCCYLLIAQLLHQR